MFTADSVGQSSFILMVVKFCVLSAWVSCSNISCLNPVIFVENCLSCQEIEFCPVGHVILSDTVCMYGAATPLLITPC